MFADKGHTYTADRLTKDGVELSMGLGVTEIGPGHVTLSDGSSDQDALRRLGWWPDGRADRRRPAACRRARAGGSTSQPDFTVAGFPGVLAIGDIANIPDKDGKTYPQLGSVALQSGERRREDDPRRSSRARRPSRSTTSTRARWR